MSRLAGVEACARLARNGTATINPAQQMVAAINPSRSHNDTERGGLVLTLNGTLSHDLSITTAPRRCRARLRHAADDRAGAHADLLGRDVLPLRVPRDLDRPVRRQRERCV